MIKNCECCSSAPAEETIFDYNNIPYMNVCKSCVTEGKKYVEDLALIVN